MRIPAILRSCALGAALVASGAVAAPDDEVAWKLDPSDFVRFERARVTVGKDGKEKLGTGEVATVHGSDLRDRGLFLPESPRRGDLPALFAFRLRRSGDASWRVSVNDTVDVDADASFRSETTAAGTVVHAEWVFASRPRGEGNWLVRNGKAAARTTFDPSGVPLRSRVSLRYDLEKTDPGKGDRPKVVDETWDFDRKDLRKARYTGFHDDVNSAIERGVAHLRTLQKEDGTFDPYGGWETGTDALALYTLLSCGVPRDDPQVAKGLDRLVRQDVKRNYELAVGLMAFERAWVEPGNNASEAAAGRGMPAEQRAWCERAAARLETQCVAPGSWGYPNGGNELYKMDSSNTQYAALGLRAAGRLGIAVREQTWIGLIRHFAVCREKDAPKAQVSLDGERGSETATSAPLAVRAAAGFRYRPHERRAHGSMTCAGIGSLAIARDELRRARSKKFGAQDEAEVEEMILGGWAWIDAHYATDRHPTRGDDWYHYWLYSLERAGLLTGVKRVGGKDWYFDGAMELLARQAKDGSWDEPGGAHTTETCFALLFLKRATAPAAAVTGK